jgi:hypothetical protein
MGESLRILEPIAEAPELREEVYAPRLSSLQGKTVLLLDNTKPNALQLLTKVSELLKSECGVREVITHSKKPTFSRAATLQEFGENLGKAHFAVTALGD